MNFVRMPRRAQSLRWLLLKSKRVDALIQLLCNDSRGCRVYSCGSIVRCMSKNYPTHEELVKTLEHDLRLFGTGVVSIAGLELADLRDEPEHEESLLTVTYADLRCIEEYGTPFEKTDAEYRGFGDYDTDGRDAFGNPVFCDHVPLEVAAWRNFCPEDMVR